MGKFKLPSLADIENENKKELDTNLDTEKKDIQSGVGTQKLQVGSWLLPDESKRNTAMATINLPFGEIVKNPNNKYSITGIPALAESIKQYGLVQPLHVAPEKDGKYMLLGGHRRLNAIELLIKDPEMENWTEDTLIPCVIKGTEDVRLDLSEENKERYAIITTNRESRVYTDGDRYMEIQEWKKIIEELREKGIPYISKYDEEGKEVQIPIQGEKTRDVLSQTVGVSRGQINKFETVHNKGSKELKNALLDGKISVHQAAKAAKELTKKKQDKLAEAVSQGDKRVIENIQKETASKETYPVTPEIFRKDTQNILSLLKEKEIVLDGEQKRKYDSCLEKLEKLLQ